MLEFDITTSVTPDPVPEQDTPAVSTVTTDSSIESQVAISEDNTGATDIDPEVLENNERLERERDENVKNFLAGKDLINRGGFSDTPGKRQANEAKRNDTKALGRMMHQHQQEMLSFKLDGVDIKISKEDFTKNLQKWKKEDTEKAEAAKKRGDHKLYEQLKRQAEAAEQLLKDIEAGKDVDPDLVKAVIGDDPSRKGAVLRNTISTNADTADKYASANMDMGRPVNNELVHSVIGQDRKQKQLDMYSPSRSQEYKLNEEDRSSPELLEQESDMFRPQQTASYSKTIDGMSSSLSSRTEFNTVATGIQENKPAEQFNQEVKYKVPDNTMSAMY